MAMALVILSGQGRKMRARRGRYAEAITDGFKTVKSGKLYGERFGHAGLCSMTLNFFQIVVYNKKSKKSLKRA
jgi:hypothetical protein